MDARTPGLFVRLALAALGGALLASAVGPLHFVLGPFLGVACLAEALGRRAGESPLRAVLLGALFGFVTHALALPSLAAVFSAFGGLGTLQASALSALTWLLQALPHALACLAAAWLRGPVAARAPDPSWLALPLCLTIACALTPQLFPWQPGALLIDVPWLVQVADLGGASAVTLCLGVTAAALRELVRTGVPRPALLIALALSVLGPAVYGSARLASLHKERETGARLRVGVVQPNVQVAQMQSESGRHAALASLRTMTAGLEREGTALTVWGESAFPFGLGRGRRMQPIDERRIVGGAVQGPVLTGVITHEWLDYQRLETNSAWLVGQGGELAQRVDKQQLVPFAEYVPRGPVLDFLGVRARGALVPGRGGSVHVAGHALGILICYEDLFAGLARARVQAGAELLVNLTNDAWFGASSEPALHERMARLRAVETRRELVRVTNTGVSSHVSATGEPLVLLAANTPASFVAVMHPRSELTPFVRLGDWVPYVCLLGLWFTRRRRAQ